MGRGRVFSIEIWEHGSVSHVVQNMQIWKLRDIKGRINEVMTRNNGKIWTWKKLVKLCISQKVCRKAMQKCNCYRIWATLSEVMGY